MMHKYEFTLHDGAIIKIESERNVFTTDAVKINDANMVVFDDIDMAINLQHVKEVEMDGLLYAVEK